MTRSGLKIKTLSLFSKKVSSVLMILSLMGCSMSLPPGVLQVILGLRSLREWPIRKQISDFIASGLQPHLKQYVKCEMSRNQKLDVADKNSQVFWLLLLFLCFPPKFKKPNSWVPLSASYHTLPPSCLCLSFSILKCLSSYSFSTW